MSKVKYILQTDTGIPWSFFNFDLWKVKLFGAYERPFLDWRSLGLYWGYQEDLHLVYDSFCYRHLQYPQEKKNICWEGFTPFHLDYGGVMTFYKLNKFTTTVMYFEKI